jgi:hypothetical protein
MKSIREKEKEYRAINRNAGGPKFDSIRLKILRARTFKTSY